MKGLLALTAVPQGAPLVYAVVADQALLAALGQALHQVGALLGQTPVAPQEVLEVVLNQGFVLGGTLFLLLYWVLHYGYLFLPLIHV